MFTFIWSHSSRIFLIVVILLKPIAQRYRGLSSCRPLFKLFWSVCFAFLQTFWPVFETCIRFFYSDFVAGTHYRKDNGQTVSVVWLQMLHLLWFWLFEWFIWGLSEAVCCCHSLHHFYCLSLIKNCSNVLEMSTKDNNVDINMYHLSLCVCYWENLTEWSGVIREGRRRKKKETN